MTSTREILNYLLPFVSTAGTYSAVIQSGVASHDAKEGSTAFHHALSDADLTIQSYLEVALLSKFPKVSFFSEEQASSLNRKYFPEDAELEVLLDPVDGTRSYIDNRSAYQIIVTVHDRSGISGALVYLPRHQQAFLGVRGEGTFVVTSEDIAQGRQGARRTLTHSSGPVLVFNRADLVQKLQQHIDVRDFLDEYERGPEGFTSMDLLNGRASAIIVAPSQAIDGGALSFLAQEAGAIVTDQHGKPVGSYRHNPKRVLPCVVAAVNREWHEKVLGLIQGIPFQ
jgi:myo-inositol-1(or 4)-monophosphatase